MRGRRCARVDTRGRRARHAGPAGARRDRSPHRFADDHERRLTIAREIQLENRSRTWAPSSSRSRDQDARVAGDGTTTATCSRHLVSRGLQAIAAGHNPMALKRASIARCKRFEQLAAARAWCATATTAAGRAVSAGDDGVGAMIGSDDPSARAGDHDRRRPRDKDTLEVVEGLRIAKGYLSRTS